MNFFKFFTLCIIIGFTAQVKAQSEIEVAFKNKTNLTFDVIYDLDSDEEIYVQPPFEAIGNIFLVRAQNRTSVVPSATVETKEQAVANVRRFNSNSYKHFSFKFQDQSNSNNQFNIKFRLRSDLSYVAEYEDDGSYIQGTAYTNTDQSSINYFVFQWGSKWYKARVQVLANSELNITLVQVIFPNADGYTINDMNDPNHGQEDYLRTSKHRDESTDNLEWEDIFFLFDLSEVDVNDAYTSHLMLTTSSIGSSIASMASFVSSFFAGDDNTCKTVEIFGPMYINDNSDNSFTDDNISFLSIEDMGNTITFTPSKYVTGASKGQSTFGNFPVTSALDQKLTNGNTRLTLAAIMPSYNCDSDIDTWFEFYSKEYGTYNDRYRHPHLEIAYKTGSSNFKSGNLPLSSETAEAFEVKLQQNVPNPVSDYTQIQYSTGVEGAVKLQLFDLNGRLIKTLVNSKQTAGNHSISVDGNTLEKGVYIYTLEAEGKAFSKKMVILE